MALGGNTDTSFLGRKPERLYITDLQTGDTIHAQFNPTDFEEYLRVDWPKHRVVGLSHRPMHYLGTENTEINFELYFDILVDNGTTIDTILNARKFLQSLCYARRGASDVRHGEAPRALFVWPNFITLNCVIDDLRFKYERFNYEGVPTRYCVKVKIEEIRDVRLYLEDVRGQGPFK